MCFTFTSETRLASRIIKSFREQIINKFHEHSLLQRTKPFNLEFLSKTLGGSALPQNISSVTFGPPYLGGSVFMARWNFDYICVLYNSFSRFCTRFLTYLKYFQPYLGGEVYSVVALKNHNLPFISEGVFSRWGGVGV